MISCTQDYLASAACTTVPPVFPLFLRAAAYSRISSMLDISFVDPTYLFEYIASRNCSFASHWSRFFKKSRPTEKSRTISVVSIKNDAKFELFGAVGNDASLRGIMICAPVSEIYAQRYCTIYIA